MIQPRPFPRIEPGEAGADVDRLARAEAFVTGRIAAGVFPGASLTAMRGGRIFLRRAWGTWCDGASRDLPYAGEHRHLLWSFSKGISATIVAMAVEEGIVDLDRPVAAYLPEFATHGKGAIRVRQLLSHSAGLPSTPRVPIASPADWDAAVAAACAARPEWAAGSRTAYHASGIFLLMAEILRRAWGGSWEDICRRRLFDPLGCPTLSFAPPPADAPLVLLPQPKALPHAVGAHFHRPDGGAAGTVEDMLAVLELVLGQGVFRGRRLLGEAACREMLRSQHAAAIDAGSAVHDAWGLGWHLRHPRGTSGIGRGFGLGAKSGPRAFAHAGIHCLLGYGDPDLDLALVFITTGHPETGREDGINDLRSAVTDLVVDALR